MGVTMFKMGVAASLIPCCQFLMKHIIYLISFRYNTVHYNTFLYTPLNTAGLITWQIRKSLFNRWLCDSLSELPLLNVHGWPSTQPGSLHTALQRKYTQPCSLFSRGTAVWTNGGTAVWTMGHGCVQVPGCVEGHPWCSDPFKLSKRQNCQIVPLSTQTIVTGPHWWWVNVGSGNQW